LVSGGPAYGRAGEGDFEEFFGEAEAIISPEATIDPAVVERGGYPFAAPDDQKPGALEAGTSPYMDRLGYQQPPEGYPDEGMGTAMEEATLRETIPPEQLDGGMSAGYPPTPDGDLPPQPSAPLATPQPSSMSGAPLFSPETLGLPDPLMGYTGRHRPSRQAEHDAQAEMVSLLVPQEKIKTLWERADQAYQQVNAEITNIPVAQSLLDHIQSARNALMAGAENYEEAERFINEVDYRIALSRKIKVFPRFYIPGLYFYQIAWAVAFLLVLILVVEVPNAFAGTRMEGIPIETYLYSSMIWGGFGGVIGALLALVKHWSIEQDFDRQHTWWYLSSPMIGIGMGIVVYLFMHVGLSATIGANGEITSPLVIYVLAWLAGYQQNVFTDLVKRMMKTLMGEDKHSDESQPASLGERTKKR
jgi:hypothetical protein